MTVRALIVDDEPPARRRLRALLKGEPGIDIVGECEDGAAAIAETRRLAPGLLFLDVQMPGLDGFDVIEALGHARCPAVIFVTAYDAYAVRAFEVNAVDYLLKPFDRARLRQALSRIGSADGKAVARQLATLMEHLRSGRPVERLVVKSRGRVHFVRVDDVDWIEAAGHYVTLHAGRDEHLIRETISNLESRLDRARFLRIQRSVIVNVDRIKEMRPTFHGEYEIALRDGTRLTSGRAFSDRLHAIVK